MDAVRVTEAQVQQAQAAAAAAAVAAAATSHASDTPPSSVAGLAAAANPALVSLEHTSATSSEPDDAVLQRKRAAAEMDAAGDYDDEDEYDGPENAASKSDLEDGKRAVKRARRHAWQPKYEMEFGLLGIEHDAVSGDVTLAMCGFCKAFGREGKYEQLLQADVDAGNDTKKRRRRSLTTTKFFRAFRVDNIRSHLQGAHPKRWAEYEMLPKQDAIRARYMQMNGDFHYEGLPIDDVVLGGSSLHSETEIPYAHAPATHHAISTMAESQHTSSTPTTVAHAAGNTSNSSANANRMTFPGSRVSSDHDKLLAEQLALERERLDLERARFLKEIELREREIAQRAKMMEQQRVFQEKQLALMAETAKLEESKLTRLAEAIRDAIAGASSTGGDASVV
ncbi:hypothetical protein P43SY_000592 [Pythium insidiosum]|uniref:Uncharacterized protein n=1 Tax=Pythium insidiosum TaxID=114742 RepID=A0AAD5LIK2_PYTIN|nr:hypothetical protein P43SY_000592 [Pythium insidiosum]